MPSNKFLTGFPPVQGTAGKNVYGARHVLLDSIRDTDFLSQSSIVNPVANKAGSYNDAGLGVVDEFKFVFIGYINPTTGNPRQYPVKAFWIGSPLGTNDATDTFSIYMADVDSEAFYPGAKASEWLLNPRLVLHWLQALNIPSLAPTNGWNSSLPVGDVISWFDANYPYTTTAAVNGVGQETPAGQGNSTYGTLSNNTNITAKGNVQHNTIDGEVWPVYDLVDNSLLLYFSIKTPNTNTLSIYAYKLPNPEVPSPATSSQFLGGLYSSGWFTQAIGASSSGNLFSSHRFSILSTDPLQTFPAVAGQQSAVMAHSCGQFGGNGPDHGSFLFAGVVTDIHGHPLSPGNTTTSSSVLIDTYGVYPIDKIGSISACPPTGNLDPGYVITYNTPSARDARASGPAGAVILSAMQIRECYYNPVGCFAFPRSPLIATTDPIIRGTCRPQVTNYPDGVPKIIYANWFIDNHLQIAYEYVDNNYLSPDRQKRMQVFPTSAVANYVLFYLWGKSKIHLRGLVPYTTTPITSGAITNYGFLSELSADGLNIAGADWFGVKSIQTTIRGSTGFGGANGSATLVDEVFELLTYSWMYILSANYNFDVEWEAEVYE